jgi:electron-transferring-flavoprotein dehydrogenase
MKSGMVAAETLFEHLYQGGDPGADLASFNERFMHSWAGRELHRSRNSGPALKHFGTLAGSAFNFLDQTFLRGRLPMTLHHRRADHACLDKSAGSSRINYTKPDNRISFDRNSSVYLTHISHDNNQPCHLKLHDPALPVKVNALDYAGVESRFCPAGVYEYTGTGTEQAFQINAQNCIHCKTCDIKDPAQNITWVPPEAGSGPNYSGM